MFLRYSLTLLTLFSLPLQAKTLHVEYGFNIYSLKLSENNITYQKKNYEEVVIKKKCSERLFKKFLTKMEALTKNFPKSEEAKADFMVKYRLGDKTGQLSPHHPFAKRLLAIPADFDTFRLSTEFRCEEENKI